MRFGETATDAIPPMAETPAILVGEATARAQTADRTHHRADSSHSCNCYTWWVVGRQRIRGVMWTLSVWEATGGGRIRRDVGRCGV